MDISTGGWSVLRVVFLLQPAPSFARGSADTRRQADASLHGRDQFHGRRWLRLGAHVANRIPIEMSLGQHIDERIFSFDAVTPSGFLFEVGYGTRQVDVATEPFHEYQAITSGGTIARRDRTEVRRWGRELQRNLGTREAQPLPRRTLYSGNGAPHSF